MMFQRSPREGLDSKMAAVKDEAAAHTLSYNGVSFGPLIKYKLRGVPEYDAARRTTTFIKYVLTVTSIEYASDEDTLALSFLTKRESLLTAGGQLTINDIGWGDTTTGGSHPEIVWGPHPLQADFTPLSGAVCWQLDWACEFKVSECGPSYGPLSGGGGSKPLVAFNYEVTTSVDDQGFTTRVISGYVQIPQLRRIVGGRPGRTVADTAEFYRKRIGFFLPENYERVQQEWHVNGAQNELRFSIIDRQMRHEPYPPGIIKADVDFSIASQDWPFLNWQFSVAGKFETTPGWPKAWAFVKFLEIARQRMQMLLQLTGGSTVIPSGLTASVRPYERVSSFRLSFLVTSKQDALKHLARMMYTPLKKNWNDWVNNAQHGPSISSLWANGGGSKLLTGGAEIVDLCKPTTGTISLGASHNRYPLGRDVYIAPSYLFNYSVPEAESWIHYEPVYEIIRDERTSIHKTDRYIPEVTSGGLTPEQSWGARSSKLPGGFWSGIADAIVRLGHPEQIVIFKGKAARVQHQVTIPTMRVFEGVQVDLIREPKIEHSSGSLLGTPVFYARWLHVYRPRRYIQAANLKAPHVQF